MNFDLFLLSHQDDEIAIFKTIKESVLKKNQILIFYLTNGDDSKINNTELISKRENESKKVLLKLGVSSKNIFFIGKELRIKSYKLINYLDETYKKLSNTIRNIPSKITIYTHAWEGGNLDHDTCFVIALKLMKNNENIKSAFQFPFYNSYRLPFNFYRVFYPLEINGKATRPKISLKEKLYFIKYLFYYQTQFKIWIGLYPFIIIKILFNKYNYLQMIDKNSKLSKPHQNQLWYEKQKFPNFDQNSLIFNSFIDKNFKNEKK